MSPALNESSAIRSKYATEYPSISTRDCYIYIYIHYQGFIFRKMIKMR